MPVATPPAEIPQVVAQLDDSAVLAVGISAQALVAHRPGSASAMIDELVARETPAGWSRFDVPFDVSRPIAVRAHVSGATLASDVFYYRPDRPADLPPEICRVRTDGRAFGDDARYVAIRWCHARLGVQLPIIRPPPVGERREPSPPQ